MDTIEIKGYKSFRDISLALKPLNILIGANGAGKSNFLSVFELLGAAYERRLAEFVAYRGGVEKFLHQGPKVTENIEIKISQDRNSYALKLHESESKFIVSSEKLGYRCAGFWDYSDVAQFGAEAVIGQYDGMKRGKYIREYMSQIKKFHFHDTGRKSPFSSECHVVNDSYVLYDQGRNLSAILWRIKKDDLLAYNRIVSVIQSVAPYFRDFYFSASPAEMVRLQWQDKYSSMIYGPNDLSDGTLRFIALVTLFLQPNLPKVIIIDEPELGLHPVAIQKLSGLIKSASQRKTQVIIATQSVDLISNFEPEDIVVADQRSGETLLTRLNRAQLTHWLDEYTIGDLWKQNILKGGQPL